MEGATKSPPSVGALLGTLAMETGTLVRQEVRLASTEMGQKAKSAALDLGLLVLGGALGHAGLLAVMFAVVTALAAFIPTWASALVIGVVTAAMGYSLVHRRLKSLRDFDPTPTRTLETFTTDNSMSKEHSR